jgi:hypothetical protein
MSNRWTVLGLALPLLAACGDHPAVLFQLNNKTVGPVFLSPGGLQSGWVSIGDAQGAPLLMVAPGCAANETPQPGLPIVAPEPPGPQRLEPGSTAELRWDGLVYRSVASTGCYEQVPAPAGRYNATICWNYEDTHGGFEEVCTIESFELATTPELVHNVIATPAAPTSLTLQNVSAASVWINSSGFDVSNPSWLSLRDPAGRPVTQAGGCTCICNRTCALCARSAVAPRPSAEELPAGQARVSSWNGILLATVTTPSGNTCALPVLAPPGSYQAHFCWGLGHTGDVTGIGADSLADVRCEDKGFELGVNTDVVLQLR